MDQQLMQRDMEELTKQAQQAVELLRHALTSRSPELGAQGLGVVSALQLDKPFAEVFLPSHGLQKAPWEGHAHDSE